MPRNKRKSRRLWPIALGVGAVLAILVVMGLLADAPPQGGVPPEIVLDMPPIKSPEIGWQTFPLPREDDFPGGMFAIDDKGKWHSLKAAAQTFEKKGRVVFPSVTMTEAWKTSILLKYLGPRQVGLDASVGDALVATVELSEVTRYIDPQFEAKTLPAAQASIGKFREGWRYFVIEETDAVGQLTVTIKGQRNGGGRLKSLLSRISATLGLEKTQSIEKRIELPPFGKDFNVFFSAREIFEPTSGAYGGTGGVRAVRVTERLIYRTD